MTDLTTLLEVGGPVAALGGGAAYARAKHPGVYWSTVGLPYPPLGYSARTARSWRPAA
jgi:hypothetical protein